MALDVRKLRALLRGPIKLKRRACLQPLGEDILSAAIPAVFIGRNNAGLWVVRETRGRLGGKFLFKWSALAFARAQTRSPFQAAHAENGKRESRAHGASN
jgi:hypothetical protein